MEHGTRARMPCPLACDLKPLPCPLTAASDALDSDGPLDPTEEDHNGRSEGVESYSLTPSPLGNEPTSWKQRVGLVVHSPLEGWLVAGVISESAGRPGHPCRSVPAPQSSHSQYSSSLGMSSVNASHTMD